MTATATGWPEPEQVPQMLRHVAADRLEDALRANPMPGGQWCVRRLDVVVELDPERPLSALETDWADRIVTALRLSLRDGSHDVVLYERPEAAVDDLLAGVVTGRCEHAWAWHQVGLLEVAHPDPRTDPAAVCLLVLTRLQHGRVAALSRLVGRVGVHAVHRLLGGAGWVQAAMLVSAESGITWAPTDGASPASTGAGGLAAADGGALDALSQALVTTGGLAVALRRCALRVDLDTLQAWSVLVICATAPSLLRSEPVRLAWLIAAVGERLLPATGPGLSTCPARRRSTTAWSGTRLSSQESASETQRRSHLGDPRTSEHTTKEPRRTEAHPNSSRTRRQDSVYGAESADSPRESHAGGAISQWGGLLYMLNSAAGAGLPGLLDEPPFITRPTPWVMHRLGLALVPVEPDDPALLAFAGMSRAEAPQPESDAEQRAIAACAQRWILETARRVRPENDGIPEATAADLVQRITRRAVTIEQEPGWVEVRLRLDDVDLDVRRAGLDVDPGWVWWLGHVVRFCYA